MICAGRTVGEGYREGYRGRAELSQDVTNMAMGRVIAVMILRLFVVIMGRLVLMMMSVAIVMHCTQSRARTTVVTL